MNASVRESINKSEAVKQDRTSRIRKSGYTQSINSSVDRILFLQKNIGNHAVGRFIRSKAFQAQLKVGQPDDIYEQEADRVADQVMRMPDSEVNNISSNPYPVQLKCSMCTSGGVEEEEALQKKENDAFLPEVVPRMDAVINAFSDSGQPLSAVTRRFFEPRFGADFSGVRVHTGASAQEGAQAIQAKAFTVGNDIVFGSGQYAPGNMEGRRLLGHELTHVVQQTGNNILTRNVNDSAAQIAQVRQTLRSSKIQRKWYLAGGKGAAGGWAGDAASGNNSIDETGICAPLSDQHSSCAKARAHTWQTRGFLKSSYGGRAKVFRWVTSEYTFKNDHTDNDFLSLTGKGSISGWAKAEDLDHARGAALIVGRITENPHTNRTSAALFPALKEGGISAASVGDLGKIEADVPVGSGSVNITINLTKVNEGTQAPINDNNSPSYNVPKSVDEVDVTIIVRVDADSDIEDEVWGGLLAAGDENTAKVVASFYLDWKSRPEVGTGTPVTGEGTEPGAGEEMPGILEEKATCKNPPGCTPDRCRDLQKEVKRLCDRKRGCWEGMSCKVARTYVKKNEECANSRRKINDECFKGGDKGHKKAEGDARQAARNCKKIIKDGKCEEKEKY